MTGDEASLVLVGAGGHAKALVEIFLIGSAPISGYVDPRPAPWLEHAVPGIRRFACETDVALGPDVAFAMGIGGVTPDSLARRLALFGACHDRGWRPRTVVHPSAVVSGMAHIEAGACILAGAIVQPGAHVGAGVIVNTGAIVEHDAEIRAGAHIAPGAIVLGKAVVGSCAMIGAGAVVLPGGEVAGGGMINSLERGRA